MVPLVEQVQGAEDQRLDDQRDHGAGVPFQEAEDHAPKDDFFEHDRENDQAQDRQGGGDPARGDQAVVSQSEQRGDG